MIDNKTQATSFFSAVPVNYKTIEAQTAFRLRDVSDGKERAGKSIYNRYTALDKAEYDIWLMLNE